MKTSGSHSCKTFSENQSSSYTSFETEPQRVTVAGFLRARCPFCHTTITGKALLETQSTGPNTTGLLMEEALLPLLLLRLSNASTFIHIESTYKRAHHAQWR